MFIEDYSRAENDALNQRLSYLGLELRPAARQNDLYRFRLSPIDSKKVLAFFRTLEDINTYLQDLENITTNDGE